jgi:hypothetical protein
VSGTVSSVLYAGSRSEYVCDVDGEPFQVWGLGDATRYAPGDSVLIALNPGHIRLVQEAPG